MGGQESQCIVNRCLPADLRKQDYIHAAPNLAYDEEVESFQQDERIGMK